MHWIEHIHQTHAARGGKGFTVVALFYHADVGMVVAHPPALLKPIKHSFCCRQNQLSG
jgi:hypothetical protein